MDPRVREDDNITYMQSLDIPFNPTPPTILHLDLNSCFATIEQQANPKLRGKPVAVAAYDSPGGCILAASTEAKTYGIKTGMRVKDGRLRYPQLIVLNPDPDKYRHVHLRLKKLLLRYTNRVTPKSIDEFVLDLNGYPAYHRGMAVIGQEIKQRLKDEIGDWLTISVGIAPNRFLAKTAAGLHKPDGLDQITRDNYLETYIGLQLTDLCGIASRNAARLNKMGIYTVLDFFSSPLWRSKAAFSSILGYYWYLRLRGWEIDTVPFARRSYGNSFALPQPLTTPKELAHILQKLIEKTGSRMRAAKYRAKGVHLSLVYRDWSSWGKGITFSEHLFDSRDIYQIAYQLLHQSPCDKPVRILAESVFDLQAQHHVQMALFLDIPRQEKLVSAIDDVNHRWGSFVISPARMTYAQHLVKDRIAFGGVKELEEIQSAWNFT